MHIMEQSCNILVLYINHFWVLYLKQLLEPCIIVFEIIIKKYNKKNLRYFSSQLQKYEFLYNSKGIILYFNNNGAQLPIH